MRLQRFHSLNEIAKVRNHFWRTARKINSGNIGLGQPFDNPVDCLARHDFLTLWACVHMTMHARQIAKLAHIDLQHLCSCVSQTETVGCESFSESIHERRK